MGAPVPPSLVAAFTFGGTVDVDYTIIPVASQVGISPELASFTTGFPPATRTARTSGGIPPRGLDMNGILYMTSAHTAWAASGMSYTFNADVVTVQGGYNLGAIVRSAANPARYFYNILADNTNDPDSVLTGWVPFSPLSGTSTLQTIVPTPGPSDNYPINFGIGFLDINPTGGACNITGMTAGFDGQLVTVTNIHASNSVTLNALNGGSSAPNQFRMAADMTLLQYSSLTFRYSSAIAMWVQI
jgi:hypothetical protein